ncbi:T9SS type A sorting domain-containing protein [bacterium]|nr:T9SS type A sorting domain-containing protein [bacterium]
MIKRSLAALCILPITALFLQAEEVTLDSTSHYLDWPWTCLVMQNGIITLATVPEIGARVMQYDLGDHPSIFTNPDAFDETYDPASYTGWPTWGGYKVWPAPQDRWNWPPPPHLDFGVYASRVEFTTPDSAAIFVSSPLEKKKSPNIRLERRTTIFKNTSRVRMEQTMINEGKSKVSWSVWDVTQSIVNHPGEKDFDNFWVYFPINPESVFGEDGVLVENPSPAWKGEVAPGVYGVQYKASGAKISADPSKGWICYVDEKDSMAYAKIFPLYEGEEYPEGGQRISVWVAGAPLYYAEVEVYGPMVEMAANVGRTTFTIDWYAAKVHGPILDINPVGAIAGRLQVNGESVSGEYGVFHVGTAQLIALDAEGRVLAQGSEHTVTPLQTFSLNEAFPFPLSGGVDRLALQVKNADGAVIGNLDELDLSGTSVQRPAGVGPGDFRLGDLFPNPGNPSVTIPFSVGRSGPVTLDVYDATGRHVARVLSEILGAGEYRVVWKAENRPGGLYLFRLQAGSRIASRKWLLLK